MCCWPAPGRATTRATRGVRDKGAVALGQWLSLPVARGPNDARITGEVFARTAAEREANRDPRPSLAERYGDHEGYVAAVKRAAARAVAQGFLLVPDADALVRAAAASAVLR